MPVASSNASSARFLSRPSELLIEVHACGVCHSDSLTVERHVPGIDPGLVPIVTIENNLGINKDFNAAYESAK